MVSVVSIVDGDQHVVHRGSVRNRLRLNSSMSALCRVLVPYSKGRSEGSVLGELRCTHPAVLGSVFAFPGAVSPPFPCTCSPPSQRTLCVLPACVC